MQLILDVVNVILYTKYNFTVKNQDNEKIKNT